MVAEGGLGGVGSYLAEAASAIFKPTKSDVPWEGTASPFSGRITHHDEVARLKKVYELVQEARQVVQGGPHPKPLTPQQHEILHTTLRDRVAVSVHVTHGHFTLWRLT